MFHLWEATSIHIHPYPSISIHGSCWTLATSWQVFRWHHWHLLAASVAFCCLFYIFLPPKISFKYVPKCTQRCQMTLRFQRQSPGSANGASQALAATQNDECNESSAGWISEYALRTSCFNFISSTESTKSKFCKTHKVTDIRSAGPFRPISVPSQGPLKPVLAIPAPAKPGRGDIPASLVIPSSLTWICSGNRSSKRTQSSPQLQRASSCNAV